MRLMVVLRGISLVCLVLPLVSQDLSKLPDWAQSHAAASQSEPAPDGADAWILFDRTEVAYVGDGEIRTRRLRLVKILGERGFSEGTFVIRGLGGKSSVVKSVKGWNLRPDGDLAMLDRNRVVTVDNASEAEASTDTVTSAVLTRLAKGSLVAFESLQVIHHPMGPIADSWILDIHPTRRWEFEPVKTAGWLTSLKKVNIRVDRRHLQPWLTRVSDLGDQGLAADEVPALPKDEFSRPAAVNVLPKVHVRFLDPDLKVEPPWTDWNAFAAWMHARYSEKQGTVLLEGLYEKKGKEGLAFLMEWMARELQYRQVYMSPERGWIPLESYEIGRRKYGDCKDLSCFLMAYAGDVGWEAYPALARIGVGEVESDEPPSLGVFNHVITAIKLKESLGFPAEVDSPQGRFLLIDPTDRFTPLGLLGVSHLNGRVLICTRAGGVWIQVPPSAIQPSRVSIHLRGESDPRGALRATLTFTESGLGWGLRGIFQEQGLKKARTHILTNILDLPPTATFEIARTGNPLDRSTPFVIEMELRHPEGFKLARGEAYLAPLGWRIVPGQIQKPGAPRQYPVRDWKGPDLEFTGSVKVPFRCTPILPEKVGDTPFRSFAWTAVAAGEESGTLLTMHFLHSTKDVFFDFSRREEGVAAAKRDRSLVKNLVADGFAFKVQP